MQQPTEKMAILLTTPHPPAPSSPSYCSFTGLNDALVMAVFLSIWIVGESLAHLGQGLVWFAGPRAEWKVPLTFLFSPLAEGVPVSYFSTHLGQGIGGMKGQGPGYFSFNYYNNHTTCCIRTVGDVCLVGCGFFWGGGVGWQVCTKTWQVFYLISLR